MPAATHLVFELPVGRIKASAKIQNLAALASLLAQPAKLRHQRGHAAVPRVVAAIDQRRFAHCTLRKPVSLLEPPADPETQLACLYAKLRTSRQQDMCCAA